MAGTQLAPMTTVLLAAAALLAAAPQARAATLDFGYLSLGW